LGAQVANTPEWGAEMMDQHFDPVVLRLIDLLKKALRDCAAEDIFWGYHFVTGALMLTLARTGRIDKLSNGLCKSNDYVAVKERIAPSWRLDFWLSASAESSAGMPEGALQTGWRCEYHIH
jgi:hypothetical protein